MQVNFSFKTEPCHKTRPFLLSQSCVLGLLFAFFMLAVIVKLFEVIVQTCEIRVFDEIYKFVRLMIGRPNPLLLGLDFVGGRRFEPKNIRPILRTAEESDPRRFGPLAYKKIIVNFVLFLFCLHIFIYFVIRIVVHMNNRSQLCSLTTPPLPHTHLQRRGGIMVSSCLSVHRYFCDMLKSCSV